MKLYLHATVLTMDPGRRVIADGGVCVDGGVLAAVGDSGELCARYPQAEVADCAGGILMPGLINTHVHTAQCLLRGMADDLHLTPWLTDRIWPGQGAYDGETYLHSARLAMAEMLLSGTTAFVEPMFAHHYGLPGMAEAVGEAGMRAVIAKIVMKPRAGMLLPASMAEPFDLSFERALAAKKQCDGAHNGRLRIWLGPRWTAMFDRTLMDRVAACMREEGFYTTLHYAESSEDVAAIADATGVTPGQFLRQAGLPGERLLLVHCTHLPQGDESMLGEMGASVAYCAPTNMKGALGLCRARDMQRAGVNVTFGTDACDTGNDLFSSLRQGALLQKHVTGDPQAFSAWDSLAMATINAARAIGMGDSIGSLEPGKRADFIFIGCDSPRMRPVNSPENVVAYTATGADVKTVVVDGRELVQEGRLVSMNLPRILADAQRTADVLRRRLELA